GDKLCNFRFSQPTLATTVVEVVFQFAKIFPVNLFQGARIRPRNDQSFGLGLLDIECRQLALTFRLDLYEDRFWQSILQAERYKVASAFSLHVRQIAASVNSAAQRIWLLRSDTGDPKLEFHAIDPRVRLSLEHERRLLRLSQDSQPLCAG